MTTYIMSGFLAIGSPVGTAMHSNEAPRYAAKAIYKELKLDDVVTRIEKRYIKLDDYPVVGYIGVVGRIISEKRVSYTWRF